MKSFPGTPGTYTGLALRVGQCLSAAGSVVAMTSARGFEAYTAYCYLLAAMGLQVIWSLLLACLDIFALVKMTDYQCPVVISLFTAGDWVTATLSLSGVSAAAGITVLFDRDLGYCGANSFCRHYQLSITLGSISWVMIEISALIMFWILSAG